MERGPPSACNYLSSFLTPAKGLVHFAGMRRSCGSVGEDMSETSFSDEELFKIVASIVKLLEVPIIEMEKMPCTHFSLNLADGQKNKRALGYIYGFTDAALRVRGFDMADAKIAFPVLWHVLGYFVPEQEYEYCMFLFDKMRSDQEVILGSMTGGQEYLDYCSGKKGLPFGIVNAFFDGRRQHN